MVIAACFSGTFSDCQALTGQNEITDYGSQRNATSSANSAINTSVVGKLLSDVLRNTLTKADCEIS